MTDREKLIELLRQCMDIQNGMLPQDAADHLISNGVVVRDKGEWINNEYGIYHCPFCGCDSAFKCDGDSYWFDLNNFCHNCGADLQR